VGGTVEQKYAEGGTTVSRSKGERRARHCEESSLSGGWEQQEKGQQKKKKKWAKGGALPPKKLFVSSGRGCERRIMHLNATLHDDKWIELGKEERRKDTNE